MLWEPEAPRREMLRQHGPFFGVQLGRGGEEIHGRPKAVSRCVDAMPCQDSIRIMDTGA